MLSIIIPVRNLQQFVGECLESVFAQEVPPGICEVLISDNGSTDETIAVIEKMLELHRDSPIKAKLFRQEKNLGAYGNLNFLIEQAAFSHVQILCADDYFNGPRAVASILQTIAAYPNVAFIGFDNNFRHADDLHWTMIKEGFGEGVIDSASFAKFLLCFGCFLGGLSNICLNKSRFPDHDYFDPSHFYYGDVHFYARAATKGADVYLARAETTVRREHPFSISSTENRSGGNIAESMAASQLLFDYLQKIGVSSFRMRLFMSWQITQFYHRSFNMLVKGRGWATFKSVVGENRRNRGYHSPAMCVIFALLTLPKIYRKPLSIFRDRKFLKYLLSHS